MFLDAYILHHSSDFDGYGSAAVAIKYLEILPQFVKINTIPVNYNTYDFDKILINMANRKESVSKKKNVKEYKRIIFVLDFCFTVDEMLKLIDESDIFIFCDHHESVQGTYEKIQKYCKENDITIHDLTCDGKFIYQTVDRFNILKIDEYLDRKQLLVNFLPTNESAACKLTYILLFQTNLIPIVLEHINDVDLYQLKSDETIHFREFLDKMPWKNYKFLRNLIFNNSLTDFTSIIDTIPLPEIYNSLGRLFRERKNETIQKLLQRFVEIRIPGFENLRVCICNNTNGSLTSELLNTACSLLGYDVAISYYDDLSSKKRSFSMRSTRDDINLNDIINKLFPGSGSGHKKSVGFTISLKEGQDFVNQNLVNS